MKGFYATVERQKGEKAANAKFGRLRWGSAFGKGDRLAETDLVHGPPCPKCGHGEFYRILDETHRCLRCRLVVWIENGVTQNWVAVGGDRQRRMPTPGQTKHQSREPQDVGEDTDGD